ncbi:MAG: RNase adapter RapZ [bacterium]
MKRFKGKIFIITGMSGAGKSQALKCFEDLGFYCVDNLPIALIPSFTGLIGSTGYLQDVALGIDVREGRFLKSFVSALEGLRKAGCDYRILFLDASDQMLLQRFSETRHRHPLGKKLSEAVHEERRMLLEIKERADRVIDTTNLTLGELKETLSAQLELRRSSEMKLSVVSFGYKYGLPMDADLVMDVRFIPNPNYMPGLKKKTGLDKSVAGFIMKHPLARRFLDKYIDLIASLLPLYIGEGKSYLTIAIGCTGGRHRSVFFAHRIVKALAGLGFGVSEYHRDMGK